MPQFTRGLFDRLAAEAEDRSLSLDECRACITRDLEALLNTRSALTAEDLAGFPDVSASVLNYGLIDFAGMCLSSDADQRRICQAVRLAIERHEPRLHKVAVNLRIKKGSINRMDFVITAELKGIGRGELMQFNAVFRPSLQRYSIEGLRQD